MKCPHCSIAFHDRWVYWSFTADDKKRHSGVAEKESNTTLGIESTHCPECQKPIFRLTKFRLGPLPEQERFIVYPQGGALRPVPPEVDKKFAGDFEEACRVLPHSQKASAALSRRCLQNLLREKAGVKPSGLASEIQEAIRINRYPTNIEKSLDAVRNIGNLAAHPIKDQHTGEVLDVESGEAEWTLDTLEELFDFYFVQPARIKKKRADLNKKLKTAGSPPCHRTRSS